MPFSSYERSATSLESGDPPSQTSRNKAKTPALFMGSPGAASTKTSPRSPTKRQCVSEKPSTGSSTASWRHPQVRPHLTKKSRSRRCLHAHLGPPIRHTVSSLPCEKGNTRRISTLRFPPINTHEVCRINRLFLSYYRNSQGPHT